jgi:DNA-binding MarR family transcriptional regulator
MIEMNAPGSGTAQANETHDADAGTAPSPALTAELVLDVVPRVMRLIRAEMRGAAGTSVTVPQLRALLFARRQPGSSLSALAEHLGIGLASASSTVDRLVRQGLMTRVQDPNERRRVMLKLTPAGTRQLDVARRRAGDALATALAGSSDAERGAVVTAMSVLDAAVDGAVRS